MSKRSLRGLAGAVAMLLVAAVLFSGCGVKKAAQSKGAPQIEGLTYQSKLKTEYAKEFAVYKYKGGYKLFHLKNSGDFLLVPEGKKAPENLSSKITVLKAPIQNIYLAATSQMALFGAMDGYGAICATSLQPEGWTFDSIKAEMNSGKIVYAGKYSAPDYELLTKKNCKLAIESTMIEHSPEIKEMLEQLDIPVMVDRSSYENNPLGRAEWIKFYGELIGKEDQAKQFFDEQKAKVKSLEGFKNTGKTVAFFYISSDGKAVVRSSKDYVLAMIEMAGAKYIFKNIGKGRDNASIPMSIEEFYDRAGDADYIVYNASIDSSVKTMADLVGKDPIMKKFKAVKNDNCWSTGSAMYQRTDIAGDMILDFHTLFTEDNPQPDLKYLTKLE